MADSLDAAWRECRAACYGSRELPPDQEREVHQAFLSGMVCILTSPEKPTLTELHAKLSEIGALPRTFDF